jgi:Domain of unknown function (DUF4499)
MQTKAPQITSFRLPLYALSSASVLAILAYFAFAPVDKMESPSLLFITAQLVHSLIGSKLFSYLFYAILGVHALESVYAYILCRRHQTGFFVGVRTTTIHLLRVQY